MEEKNLNYKKFWGWGVGLILVLMAIAYFAGLITFGVPEKATQAERKAYFHKDSTIKPAIAAMDSSKNKKESNNGPLFRSVEYVFI
nr:hypothetical protein [uncultured Emticicia sp.]